MQLDFEGSLSPVIAPKKARPSETGSDEVRNGSILKIRGRGWGRGVWFDVSLKAKHRKHPLNIVFHLRLQTPGGRKGILPFVVAASCDPSGFCLLDR